MDAYLLIYLIGVVFGIVLTRLWMDIRSVHGIFRIDKSNKEKDIYRLDIDELDDIEKKKYVILTVDSEADLSQK